MLARWLVFLLIVSSATAAELPSALDAMDEHYIELALRALKMTEHDLSFVKTNAESELVLGKVRTFLQQPLALPVYGQSVLSNCIAMTSLSDAADFSRRQLEVSPSRIRVISPVIDLDSGFLEKLPPAVAQAVVKIVAAASVSRILLQQALPSEKNLPLAAFGLETLQLDKDKLELESWERLGLDTQNIRGLLRRDENLELQDTEIADAILNASDKFDRATLLAAFTQLVQAVDEAVSALRTNSFREEFEVSTDTPLGEIICGGVGRNVYTNEAFLIIDTGGDDVYENSAGGANGLLGRPISVLIDLAGNDQYASRRSFSQGSGVFGIGILVDIGGDDVFVAKNLSQGAGFFGCGLLMTGHGKQQFEADTFCQGAGEFGVGILWQRGGDTGYKAAEMAQGFGGVQGCGLLLDGGGDDSYFAGGKFACAWLPGRFFSLSQGFGYGMRPFTGGGVGILCDLKGNDRYIADVYGQGASYWYSTGLLLDQEGDDVYRAYQYCQGAGIHLSSGALIDWGGNDQYSAEHICQGAAHDYSVGILLDRAGNDIYDGSTTAQGAAINNSFALLLDRAGDDVYTGRDPLQSQATGHNGDKREYGSIALMLDLGGKDKYSQGQPNNAMWLKPLYGAGLDAEVASARRSVVPRSAELANPTNSTSQKRFYSIEPVDLQYPVERLLRHAISDKQDAAAAWNELKQLGAPALSYLLTRLDSPNVLVRAKTEELIDYLGTNSVPSLIAGIAVAKNDEVARLCCYFLARFDEKATAAIPVVLPLLNREKTRVIAFYTLGHMRAREVFEPALSALTDAKEGVRLRAAQALGKICSGNVGAASRPRLGPVATGRSLLQMQRESTPHLISALDDEMWDVRYAAEDALVVMGQPSIPPLRRSFAAASSRARPHIVEALAKLGDRHALALARSEYKNDDPLVRAAVEKELAELLAAAKKH
jgi:HEAT repeat protein